MRIATFNIHFGKNAERIALAIQSNENLARAEVFFLQEVEEHRGEMPTRAEKIANALGFSECRYAPARSIRGGTHGLAILSRYPLRDTEIMALPPYRVSLYARERIAFSATLDHGGVPLRLSNIHLDTRLTSAERMLQLTPVIASFERDPDAKVVIGGDFNTIPFETKRALPTSFYDQRKHLHEHLSGKGFETHCESAGHTFQRGFMKFELDGIYVRNLAITDCGVERAIRVSDHKPLWVDVNIAS